MACATVSVPAGARAAGAAGVKIETRDWICTDHQDYEMIFVSDATMRPYEILQSGSNGGHHRRETGAEWLQRHTHAFPEYAWINPEPQGMWEYHQSIAIICRFMGERMYPLTLKGLEETMRLLSK